MHICLAAADLIRERGLQVDPALTTGKGATGITLHQALRRAAGIHPGAWLGAYVDYRASTATYEQAVTALRAEVARRSERPIEMTVWAERVTSDEVLDALRVAAEASPGADVAEPPPRLRPGCNPKQWISSVKIGGVLVAALRLAAEGHPDIPVAVLATRAAEGDLTGCDNEAFLDGLDALVPVDFAPAGPVPHPPPSAAEVCDALAEAVTMMIEYRAPRLLAVVGGAQIESMSDGELGERLRRKVAQVREHRKAAQEREVKAKA